MEFLPVQGGGGLIHCPLSRHVILKSVVSSLVLSKQLRRIYDPGKASSVDVSNTLITESITDARLVSIGGGSEQRGFSFEQIVFQ